MNQLSAHLRPWMNNALNYWQQLSTREQLLSATASVAVAFWLVWLFIVTPLSERHKLAEKQLVTSRTQLTTIQQQAEQILRLRAASTSTAPIRNLPIDQAVHQLAAKHQLTVQRVQNRDALVTIDLANVRFDQLLKWLTALEQEHDIVVNNIQLESTQTGGMIDVRRLQLKRG